MSIEAFEKLTEEKKNRIISTGIKQFSQKSYKDVSTDTITKECGISKGILFHYFGSKKEYYFYCLNYALCKLTAKTERIENAEDFYDILFSSMDKKLSLCMACSDEMHMVNMASRDASIEIAERKMEIIQKYMMQVRLESGMTLKKALQTLKFKDSENMEKTLEGLSIYINAILNKYLLQYQETPDAFFKNSDKIKAEMKIYFDFMLFGICKE